MGIEKKFLDTSSINAQLNAPSTPTSGEKDPATILCLNGVPQGDTSSSRDGMKIAMTSVFIKGVVELVQGIDQTIVHTMPTVYIALVLDTQTNGAQLNSEDVFFNPAASQSLATSLMRNMSFTERFKVLKSTTMTFPQMQTSYDGTNIEQGGQFLPFTFAVPLKGMNVKYTTGTTSGFVDTIQDNSLHLIAFINNTTVLCRMSYNSRLRYVG